MARKSASRSHWRENVPLLALIAFLVLVFITGGGSRPDVQSLVILRPMAILFGGFAVWSLSQHHLQSFRILLIIAFSTFALVALHLVPLPPALWSSLPGRDLAADVDRVSGLNDVWRPVTLVPDAGWNALFALSVPLTVLLFSMQIRQDGQRLILYVLIGLALLSGFWGLLQAVGDPRGPLYLYRITNHGTAVGLFANRNHQAILLAMTFPMLAVFASIGVRTPEQAKARLWVVIVFGVVLVPLLLVTGSRAGLVLGAIGIAAFFLLYRRPRIDTPAKRKVSRIDWRLPAVGVGVVGLGALTLLMSRAEALSRLIQPDEIEEQRFQVWGPIFRLAQDYFPVGSGAGSFVEVYQTIEPLGAVSPNYLNHAHNDWLELYLTAGLPGMLILLVAIIAYARATITAFRPGGDVRELLFARLGAVLIAMLALASVVDYPLRTPSLACVLVIAAVWLSAGRSANRKILAEPVILG